MPAGITISGGASSLPGMDHLAEDIFNVPVRIYVPDFMSVRYPTFTNAIGLVVTETNLSEVEELMLETVLEKTVSNENVRANHQAPVREVNPSQSDETTEVYETTEMENKEPFGERMKNFFSSFFD